MSGSTKNTLKASKTFTNFNLKAIEALDQYITGDNMENIRDSFLHYWLYYVWQAAEEGSEICPMQAKIFTQLYEFLDNLHKANIGDIKTKFRVEVKEYIE